MLKILLMGLVTLLPVQTAKADDATASKSLNVYQGQWQNCDQYLISKGFFFKIANVKWYTDKCQANHNILSSSPVLLRFEYFRDVDRQFFIDSATEYFLRNLDMTNKQSKSLIKEFNSAYENVKEGEVYDLLIDKKGSLKLYKNKRLLQSTNQVLISKNYLKFWFGKVPVVPSLKEAFAQ
jgi:hypothetical protein